MNAVTFGNASRAQYVAKVPVLGHAAHFASERPVTLFGAKQSINRTQSPLPFFSFKRAASYADPFGFFDRYKAGLDNAANAFKENDAGPELLKLGVHAFALWSLFVPGWNVPVVLYYLWVMQSPGFALGKTAKAFLAGIHQAYAAQLAERQAANAETAAD